eukprot:m.648739 g.648739  ORF g.648739 m.648739 type:complete len:79 (-) comp58387_c0_seq37:1321-1557(-)
MPRVTPYSASASFLQAKHHEPRGPRTILGHSHGSGERDRTSTVSQETQSTNAFRLRGATSSSCPSPNIWVSSEAMMMS